MTKGAVSQWLKRAREQGSEALRSIPRRGHTRRLSAKDEARVPELLARGPQAYGFRGDLWSRRRVADVIRREFGVSYSRWQVGHILHRLGYSLQKPIRRAWQRDEAAVERWQREKPPTIQKTEGLGEAHARVRR